MIFESPAPEPTKKPIEPHLGSVGRAIADRWVIRAMINLLNRSGQIKEIAIPLGLIRADLKRNVNKALEAEMGDWYDIQLNTPALRRDCNDRLLYLLREEMKIIDENDQTDCYLEP